MADTEVENILREIRERVYAEEEAAAAARHGGSNGVRAARENGAAPEAGSLPRLDSYLTTTARAWDRLPPLVSNRSGATARLELWLKRHFKRATRWYAWEQVNFNAAVHHALGEMAQLLAAHEKTIADLRETEKAVRQQQTSAVQALRSELAGQLSRQLAEQRQSLEAATHDVDRRLAEVVNDLREGIARLQDEIRVSYKQLSLEESEAAVLEDRARRKTEALLAELERRVQQLEKS
jgi:hypothetical protein